jgi:hypothetical protein
MVANRLAFSCSAALQQVALDAQLDVVGRSLPTSSEDARRARHRQVDAAGFLAVRQAAEYSSTSVSSL